MRGMRLAKRDCLCYASGRNAMIGIAPAAGRFAGVFISPPAPPLNQTEKRKHWPHAQLLAGVP
jgi:hypothetical protein